MTTFQTIICMAILALLVGLAIWFDWKTNKDCSSDVDIVEKRPLTKQNIEDTLKELGARDFKYPDDQWVFFRMNGGILGLDASIFPTVKLVVGLDIEEEFDLKLAKKVAEDFNKDNIGLLIEITDNREMGIACFSTAVTCYTLKEILPYMTVYLEEARLRFLHLYKVAATTVKETKTKKKSS